MNPAAANEHVSKLDEDAVDDIAALVQWFGVRRIDTATASLKRSLRSAGGFERDIAIQNQPLPLILRRLASTTPSEICNFVTKESSVADVARLGSAVRALNSSETSTLPVKYKDDLLGAGYQAFVFEVLLAGQFQRLGYTINWCRSKVGPKYEFAALGKNELRINVECKRIHMDVAELLKRNIVGIVADRLVGHLRDKELCGDIFISFDRTMAQAPRLAFAKLQPVMNEFGAGTKTIALSQSSSVRYDLRKETAATLSNAEYLACKELHHPDEYLLGSSISDGNVHRNPIFLHFRAPKQSAEWLKKKIDDVLCRAADRQLPASAPGLVALQLSGLQSFDAIGNAGHLVDEVFKRTHIVGAMIVCRPNAISTEDILEINMPAQLFWNTATLQSAAMLDLQLRV